VRLRHERLAARLSDCTPEELRQFTQVLHRLARDLLAEMPRRRGGKLAAGSGRT
jgi:hypothetical protein